MVEGEEVSLVGGIKLLLASSRAVSSICSTPPALLPELMSCELFEGLDCSSGDAEADTADWEGGGDVGSE